MEQGRKKQKLHKKVREHVTVFTELWAFMRVRKKWWIGPIIALMLLLGLFIVLTQGSALAPFIYTLF